MRAVVGAGGALVHVHALLGVARRYDPAREARADVPAGRQVSAEVLAPACGRTNVVLVLEYDEQRKSSVAGAGAGARTLVGVAAGVQVVAAQLVRRVAAVVRQVAELRARDAVPVRALELLQRVAGSSPRRAQRHVVLVRPVAAVVDAVAHLVPVHVDTNITSHRAFLQVSATDFSTEI